MSGMSRTESNRNLLGAFLGGLLGILVSGYFSSWGLPLGVLVGVVLGYWHREIWSSVVRRWRAMNDVGRRIRSYCASAWSPFAVEGGSGSSSEQWKRGILLAERANIVGLVAAAAINLLLLVIVLYQTYRAFSRSSLNDGHGGDIFWTIVTGLIETFVFVIIGLTGICYAYELSGRDLNKRVVRWSMSPTRFVVLSLLHALYLEVVLSVAVAWGAFVVIGIGSIFTLVVIVPSVLLVMVSDVIKISLRSGGHGICLAVTLSVTALSVYIFYPIFYDRMALWSVALVTGFVSALVTKRVVAYVLTTEWWLENSKHDSGLEDHLNKVVDEGKRRFASLREVLCEGLFKMIPCTGNDA